MNNSKEINPPELPSVAERRAELAQKYGAFSGINLTNIRTALKELLAHIGRLGIFHQYTNHDIRHIDKLLASLEWIVPPATQKAMTPADWLMIVLAIYFHDLGMLVTKSEYDDRHSSGFECFKEDTLFGKMEGPDYRSKVTEMTPEDGDKFCYQEFVRWNHAHRISQWITGKFSKEFGSSDAIGKEVRTLVQSLGHKFCRDLGIVCESHHREDLYDLNIYKVSQPYGDSEAETANLQYASILLRTVDLLHVTKDRAPSLAFRLINPSDPISQEEWYKQMAVVAVRPTIAINAEGHADPGLPRDTIEIHAFFDNSHGFFALTNYVGYLKKQLRTSFDWCREAKLQKGIPHEFPWRSIDDSQIETDGFLSEQFSFTFDQPKILDLLTGHTLYNDINVVLRELVQNSLDAVRLQAVVSKQAPGRVRICWNTQKRELIVEDQGTGMTQDIVTKHLLTVGSSRYQSPEFRKQFPAFSPISRFGIGVLSTFMISDEVDIVTCHEQEPKARQMSMRSVHGKYLIRLLDKKSDEARDVAPHGTRIRLKLRPSVKMPDVLKTAQTWIVMPGCPVEVDCDGNKTSVGFQSLKDALLDYCQREEFTLSGNSEGPKIRIVEQESGGVSLAIAVGWSEFFKEWSFLIPRRAPEKQREALGICIEGIRVTQESPGFRGFPIVALANTSGAGGPKTNVARSGLEAGPERDSTLATIYQLICAHVADEVRKLINERGFSLTWSAGEGKWLMRPVLSNPEEARPVDDQIFAREIDKTPVLVMERDNKRELMAPADFQSQTAFWTIDCGFFSSAELLLKEVPGETSLGALSKIMGGAKFPLPSEPILCGIESWQRLDQDAFLGKEVSEFRIFETQRRVDLKWTSLSVPARWKRVPNAFKRLIDRPRRNMDISVATVAIPVSVASPVTAIKTFGNLFLLEGTPIAAIVSRLIDEAPNDVVQTPATIMLSALCNFIVSKYAFEYSDPDTVLLNHFLQQLGHSEEAKLKYGAEVLDAIQKQSWRCFDPSKWARKMEKAEW